MEHVTLTIIMLNEHNKIFLKTSLWLYSWSRGEIPTYQSGTIIKLPEYALNSKL